MARDNFQHLFYNRDAATTTSTTSSVNQSNSSTEAVVNFNQWENGHDSQDAFLPRPRPSSEQETSAFDGVDWFASSSSSSAPAPTETATAFDSAHIPIDRRETNSNSEDVLVGFVALPSSSPSASSTTPQPRAFFTTTFPDGTPDILSNDYAHQQHPQPLSQQAQLQKPPPTHQASTAAMPSPPTTANAHNTRPGSESIQFLNNRLKTIGSNIGSLALLKPLRDLQLAEKLHAINLENEELEADRLRRQLEAQDRQLRERERRLAEQSETLARELQEQEDMAEMERIKREADVACHRIGRRYDSLVKFVERSPHGTYEEFIEFLLLGGGGRKRSGSDGDDDGDGNDDDGGEDYNSLLFENFYDRDSEYRKLWNDNLTMGITGENSSATATTTLEGRSFVPAVESATRSDADFADPWHMHYQEKEEDGARHARSHTYSEDSQSMTFRDHLRQRTFSEGERIKKQIAQVDKQKIKQQFDSAVNVLSNVSSLALKPLRDLQLAEKLNAMNLDMEEEETRKEVEKWKREEEERREVEEMMRLKREAEESCLQATREHLLSFVKNRYVF